MCNIHGRGGQDITIPIVEKLTSLTFFEVHDFIIDSSALQHLICVCLNDHILNFPPKLLETVSKIITFPGMLQNNFLAMSVMWWEPSMTLYVTSEEE
jgi:hypothetical protein